MTLWGNVWEWCTDHWHPDYRDAPIDGAAWLVADGAAMTRVLRGGSWDSEARVVRAAYRYHRDPAFRDSNIGFRGACSGVAR
jgi:formylglycine-generating enzyme required for sulfatase activity